MKKSELIDCYYKLLHLKNYSTSTEKSYLHHMIVFLDYVKSAKVSNVDATFLLTYFNWLKEVKNFSYSSMKQALAAIRFIQEILGHKHLSATQIYTHINPVLVKTIKSPFNTF